MITRKNKEKLTPNFNKQKPGGQRSAIIKGGGGKRKIPNCC
jgi:hypothetical protein